MDLSEFKSRYHTAKEEAKMRLFEEASLTVDQLFAVMYSEVTINNSFPRNLSTNIAISLLPSLEIMLNSQFAPTNVASNSFDTFQPQLVVVSPPKNVDNASNIDNISQELINQMAPNCNLEMQQQNIEASKSPLIPSAPENDFDLPKSYETESLPKVSFEFQSTFYSNSPQRKSKRSHSSSSSEESGSSKRCSIDISTSSEDNQSNTTGPPKQFYQIIVLYCLLRDCETRSKNDEELESHLIETHQINLHRCPYPLCKKSFLEK